MKTLTQITDEHMRMSRQELLGRANRNEQDALTDLMDGIRGRLLEDALLAEHAERELLNKAVERIKSHRASREPAQQ